MCLSPLSVVLGRPQVVSRAEKIAEELGRVARETVEEQKEPMQHGGKDTGPQTIASGPPLEKVAGSPNASSFLNV